MDTAYITLFILQVGIFARNGEALIQNISAVNCDFETACSWQHDANADFKWNVTHGATSSPNTGPQGDHTLRGQGHYIYMESSDRLNGAIARIKTDTIDNRAISLPRVCFQFYYHMKGKTVGEFSIFIDVQGEETKVYSLKGHQKSHWSLGRVEFKRPTNRFRIVLQGKTSYSIFGDIGIDDVTLAQEFESCYTFPPSAIDPDELPTPPPVPRSGPEDFRTCGKTRHSEGRIGRLIGGSRAAPGQWPWMAMLLLRNFSHLLHQPSCGGTLLGMEWIVTAAHCVAKLPSLDNIRVRLGAYERDPADNKRVQDLQVRAIYVHPRYKTQKLFHNDVAVLRLDRPAKINENVSSICLKYDSKMTSSDQCYITGWGGTGKEAHSSVLRHGKVSLQEHTICEKAHGDKFTDSMLCAGEREGKPDTCLGDSGGPLVCRSKGKWVLTGITSWGDGCGKPHKYGVYTRVETVEGWIKSVTKFPHKHPKFLEKTNDY